MTHLAILIDGDHLSADLASRIVEWSQTKSELLSVRLFANPSALRRTEWCDLATRYGFEVVFQPSTGTGKNSTDIALTIHAMDLLYQGGSPAFCLVSNDRDFIPLASRLRKAGAKVYAIGTSLSDRMKAICTDSWDVSETPPIVAAFRRVVRDGNVSLVELGKLLKRHEPRVAPKSGKLLKTLRETGCFEITGAGNQCRVTLKPPA